MKSFVKSTLLLGIGSALAASSAMGAFTFNNGDLILGFQATGGTGGSKNVFFNLGSGISHRDSPGSGLIGNISTTLSAVYGANWYTRTDLYFGVVGNLNNQPNLPANGGRGPVDGDPSRTFYLSTPTLTLGSGLLYTAAGYPPDALGSAGTSLSGMESMIVGLNTEADGAAILDETSQPVQWANGWSSKNPTPGAAFGVFTGGIQQNFGKGTSETYVDLQRVLATNTGATPAGVVGGGTYETTFAIGSNGSISAVPEPTSSLLALVAGLTLSFRRRRNA